MHVDAAWMSPISSPPGETRVETAEPGTFEQLLNEQQNIERGEVLLNQPNAAGILPDFTLTLETMTTSEEEVIADENMEVSEEQAEGLAALVQSVYWQARPQELPTMAMATLLAGSSPTFSINQVSLLGAEGLPMNGKPISMVREVPATQREGFLPELAPTVSIEEAAPFLKVGAPAPTANPEEVGVEVSGLTRAETPQAGWDEEMSAAIGLTKIAGSVEDKVRIERTSGEPVLATGGQLYSPKVVAPNSPVPQPRLDVVIGETEGNRLATTGDVIVSEAVPVTTPSSAPVQAAAMQTGPMTPNKSESVPTAPTAQDVATEVESAVTPQVIATKPTNGNQPTVISPATAQQLDQTKVMNTVAKTDAQVTDSDAVAEVTLPQVAVATATKTRAVATMSPTYEEALMMDAAAGPSVEREIDFAAEPTVKLDAPMASPESVIRPEGLETSKSEIRIAERTNTPEPREILRQAIEQIEKLQELRPPTRVTLTLNPENLGTIEVTVTRSGGETNATLHSTHQAVHQALVQGKDQLLQSAEAKGLTFASFDLTQGQSQGQQNERLNQQDFERRVHLRGNDQEATASAPQSVNAGRYAEGLDLRI